MEPVGFLNSDDVELLFIYTGCVGCVLQQLCGPCPEVLDTSWFIAALGTSEVKRHSRSHGHRLLTFRCLRVSVEVAIFSSWWALNPWCLMRRKERHGALGLAGHFFFYICKGNVILVVQSLKEWVLYDVGHLSHQGGQFHLIEWYFILYSV